MISLFKILSELQINKPTSKFRIGEKVFVKGEKHNIFVIEDISKNDNYDTEYKIYSEKTGERYWVYERKLERSKPINELEINQPNITKQTVYKLFDKLRSDIFNSNLRTLDKLSLDNDMNYNILSEYIDDRGGWGRKNVEVKISWMEQEKVQPLYKALKQFEKKVQEKINPKVQGNVNLDELQINKPKKFHPGQKVLLGKTLLIISSNPETYYTEEYASPSYLVDNPKTGERWYQAESDLKKINIIKELEINHPTRPKCYPYKEQIDKEILDFIIKEGNLNKYSNTGIIELVYDSSDNKDIIDKYIKTLMREDEDYEKQNITSQDILEYINENKDISQYLAKIIWKYYWGSIDINEIKHNVYERANITLSHLDFSDTYTKWDMQNDVEKGIWGNTLIDPLDILDNDMADYLEGVLLYNKDYLNELQINKPNSLTHNLDIDQRIPYENISVGDTIGYTERGDKNKFYIWKVIEHNPYTYIKQLKIQLKSKDVNFWKYNYILTLNYISGPGLTKTTFTN